MNFLSSLTLGGRLRLGFGSLVLIGLVMAGAGWWSVHRLQGEVAELAQHRLIAVMTLGEMKQNANDIASSFRNAMLSSDAATREAQLRRKDELAAANAALRKQLGTTASGREGEMLRAVEATRLPYVETRTTLEGLIREGRDAEARKHLFDDVVPAQLAYFRAVDELRDHHRHEALANAARAEDLAHRSQALLGSLALVGGLLGAVVSWRLPRGVVRQLGGEPAEAVRVATAIAAGDLAVRVPVRDGDGASVMAAMRGMRDRLAEVVAQVRHSSDSVATGSTQIASGSADLSQRTEEQASSLQQTAASMEELTHSVQANAEAAAEANRLAAAAAQAAEQGGGVVAEVVTTMQGISQASQRIGDIVGVIDGIAFQTNILALNAAVEAARAGAQGRGFAVVAAEVRLLAQRSAEAAKEIKALIGQSGDRVEAGVQSAGAAGEAITAIVEQVRGLSQLIAGIADASAQQASGIGEVGAAMAQLDQVTQQNAALVEETSAAAESLSSHAGRLADTVGLFRLETAAQRH